MVKDADGKQGARAYIRTPHLDKNWHRTLPYVTEAKRRHEELRFFHGLLLALAYGKIKTDKNGEFFITRSVEGGYGNYIDNDVALTYKNKPLVKTDVAKLITVLKMDKVFTDYDIPKLEKYYENELEDMTTYVGTEVLKGLTTKQDDVNPINFITRYNESIGHDVLVTAALISAVEKIAMELAEKYSLERSEKQLEEAKFRVCKRIYDSGSRVKGKSQIFRHWEESFDKYKFKEEAGEGSSN